MNKWYGAILAPFLLFFITASSWFFWRTFLPDQTIIDALCALKADAPVHSFQTFLDTCAAHESSYTESVQQFIARKKEAAIHAVQKEWQIDAQQFQKLMEPTEQYQAYMQGDLKEGHIISCPSKRYTHVKQYISDILTANGITNACVRVVTDCHILCPAIYFVDQKSNPYFMLTVPRGFEHEPDYFQKGDLEHELTHLACCHPLSVHDVSNYLACRDGIDRRLILDSTSFQKWMRACEYEADLLPALNNPTTAENVLCALDDIKITDEVHPPTRKRKKMVMRVKRLGELALA